MKRLDASAFYQDSGTMNPILGLAARHRSIVSASIVLFALMFLITGQVAAQSVVGQYSDPSLLQAPSSDDMYYPETNRHLHIEGKVVLELTVNQRGRVEHGEVLSSEVEGNSISTGDNAKIAQARFEHSAISIARTARYTQSTSEKRVRKMTILFTLAPCAELPKNSIEVVMQVCAPPPPPPSSDGGVRRAPISVDEKLSKEQK